jgi:hypothetical protein
MNETYIVFTDETCQEAILTKAFKKDNYEVDMEESGDKPTNFMNIQP